MTRQLTAQVGQVRAYVLVNEVSDFQHGLCRATNSVVCHAVTQLNYS